uniref:Uncharacterized protein n=1 Tax=Setaria viridis TaxID=4556 RepID=A0A4U6WES0_SETVI|nr:hypothetical protein SEVIR_1G306300v2 [Setaria viridis]
MISTGGGCVGGLSVVCLPPCFEVNSCMIGVEQHLVTTAAGRGHTMRPCMVCDGDSSRLMSSKLTASEDAGQRDSPFYLDLHCPFLSDLSAHHYAVIHRLILTWFAPSIG